MIATPANSEYREVSIEAGNELTSGAIFVHHQDFYLSEWMLLLPMKRIDKYYDHLTLLGTNLRKVVATASTASPSIKTEVKSMLDEIEHIKGEIRNFRLTAAHQRRRRSAPARKMPRVGTKAQP